jgi:hypothetical protein
MEPFKWNEDSAILSEQTFLKRHIEKGYDTKHGIIRTGTHSPVKIHINGLAAVEKCIYSWNQLVLVGLYSITGAHKQPIVQVGF